MFVPENLVKSSPCPGNATDPLTIFGPNLYQLLSNRKCRFEGVTRFLLTIQTLKCAPGTRMRVCKVKLPRHIRRISFDKLFSYGKRVLLGIECRGVIVLFPEN